MALVIVRFYVCWRWFSCTLMFQLFFCFPQILDVFLSVLFLTRICFLSIDVWLLNSGILLLFINQSSDISGKYNWKHFSKVKVIIITFWDSIFFVCTYQTHAWAGNYLVYLPEIRQKNRNSVLIIKNYGKLSCCKGLQYLIKHV